MTAPAVAVACLILTAFVAGPARGGEESMPYQRARLLATQKNWELARTDALEAAESDPANVRAWFLLGIIEERLGHAGPSAFAYGKAAALDATSPLGRVAVERQQTLGAQADGEARHRYSFDSGGFFVEYSPKVAPGLGYGGRLGDPLKTGFDAGFRFEQKFSLGFRYASGKVERFSSPGDGKPGSAVTYTNGTHQVYELQFGFAAPLVRPYGPLGPVGLELPLYFNIAYATLRAGGKNFEDALMGVSGGLRLSLSTKRPFLFHASALYTFTRTAGMNAWGQDPVSGPAGQVASGNFSGPEFRVGVTLLFGAERAPDPD